MHYRLITSAISRPLSTLIALAIGALLMTGQIAQAQQLPHSHARPDQVKIKHLHLDAKVDFDTKRISGSVTLTSTLLIRRYVWCQNRLSRPSASA